MDNSVVSYGHDFSKGFLRFRNVRVGRTAIIEPLAQILPGALVPDGCRVKSKSLVLPLTSCPDLAQAWRSLPPIALLDEMLSASELPSLYAAADAFVLPSRGEGWDRPVTG